MKKATSTSSIQRNLPAKNRFVVIMAGGKGERFWPVSREKTPKQLITLLGNRSFLQQAVARVSPVIPTENIFVITNQVQAAEVRRQLPQLPKENVVAEPCGRDTCPAVALGASLVGARTPDGVMAVLPADHVIPNEKAFQQVLLDCLNLAGGARVIVTIGIKPTEPATGYGYIKSGALLPPIPGVKVGSTAFHTAERFVEKPPFETAVKYLESGEYRWNAGMFIWSHATVMEGLRQYRPEMEAASRRWMLAAPAPAKLTRMLKAEYPSITKISIDYALLEHATNVVLADGAFAWDDLGAWSALARHLPPDQQGNCAVGDFIHVDAARNLVFDARTKNRTPITAVGVCDLVLVHTDDAVLVAHKNESQKIKELVKKLSSNPRLQSLV